MKQNKKEEGISMRQLYELPDAIARRDMMQSDINKDKFIIDKSIFKKTTEEKEELRGLKRLYKKYNP